MLHSVQSALPILGPSWMDPNYLLAQYGTALIWVSLAIIFIECGLLFPILPGDSLLFAIGLFIATGKLPISLWLALILLFAAAFLGNVVGYEIGRALGPAIYRHDGRIIKRKYWDQTHDFFEKHGNKALVIGRFVPIVRTFVTVVAGDRPDGPAAVPHLVGGRRGAVGLLRDLPRLLPRPGVPRPSGQARHRHRPRRPRVADPGGRRVVAAPP